jgi:heat shock protein HslJ
MGSIRARIAAALRTGAMLLMAHGLIACAASAPGKDMTPTLNNTAWTLSGLAGRTLPTGSTPTMQFDAGRVQGSDGCNRYSAPYTAVEGRFELGSPGVSTQMACPEPITRLASDFNAALARARSYRIDGTALVLLDAGGVALATFAPQATGLAGTAWEVTGYNNGRQAVVSVQTGTRLTVEFMSERRVSGSAGCNSFVGTYTAAGSVLTIGPLASTRKACLQPEGIMEQEAAFLRALETVATARREGERLELRTASGALAATLKSTSGSKP